MNHPLVLALSAVLCGGAALLHSRLSSPRAETDAPPVKEHPAARSRELFRRAAEIWMKAYGMLFLLYLLLALYGMEAGETAFPALLVCAAVLLMPLPIIRIELRQKNTPLPVRQNRRGRRDRR